jgi:hypothetical protein
VSPFRPDRRRTGLDRFLEHKMLIFAAGATAAVAGMATGQDRLVQLAIVILAAGLLLRLWADRRERLRAADDAASADYEASDAADDDVEDEAADAAHDAADDDAADDVADAADRPRGR